MENLNQYRDKNTFQVPDGYFEDLQNDVIQKIRYHQKTTRRKRLIISFSSVAACLLIVVGLFSFFHQDGQSVLVSSMDTVSDAVIIQQPFSEAATNPESITADEKKSHNETQLANSGSVKSAKKDILKSKSQQFDNLDYEIVDSYADELVYADIMELYSE
jgi:flagellar biosynthesis/type III secretory pathway M-ring protein FliF/YscJ